MSIWWNNGPQVIQHQPYAGVTVQLTRAPLGRRIMALVIDQAIIGMAAMMLTFFALIFFPLFAGMMRVLVTSIKWGPNVGILVVALIAMGVLVLLLVPTCYFAWFHFKEGQTPGKKILNLSVISLGGQKLTLKQCLVREICRYVDGFLALPVLLFVFFTKKGQRIGDLMADTMVVFSPSAEAEKAFIYMGREDFLMVKSHVLIAPWTKDQANACLKHAFDRFVSRRDLPQETISEWETIANHTVSVLPESSEQFNSLDKLLFLAEYSRFITGGIHES